MSDILLPTVVKTPNGEVEMLLWHADWRKFHRPHVPDLLERITFVHPVKNTYDVYKDGVVIGTILPSETMRTRAREITGLGYEDSLKILTLTPYKIGDNIYHIKARKDA